MSIRRYTADQKSSSSTVGALHGVVAVSWPKKGPSTIIVITHIRYQDQIIESFEGALVKIQISKSIVTEWKRFSEKPASRVARLAPYLNVFASTWDRADIFY